MIDYTAATPKTYFYIHDAHDNVIGLADSSGYRVVNYEYDAWGNILNATGTVTLGNGLLLVNENPFRYCGYQFDTETGWYYLKSRYYAPSIARFLTRDVMLNLNRYSYAANNPVTNFDPEGFVTMAMDGGGSARPKVYYHARTVYQPKKKTNISVGEEVFGIGMQMWAEAISYEPTKHEKNIGAGILNALSIPLDIVLTIISAIGQVAAYMADIDLYKETAKLPRYIAADRMIQEGVQTMMIENLSQSIKNDYIDIMNTVNPNIQRQQEEFKRTQYYLIFGR